ncbi:hypothetical protein [Nodosilinea sp. P-1105]|uniref:hypothetical protein n=1 Tax=Nodosilinea sp. P-1105 TaxID=2546229 RepID=UPI00146B45B6|nr:hypothetical protein [Nodosilinea sp. P-1105]NMF85214.1 hypothetical protein [Nodosilinea sp. P-1105]
MAASPRRFQSQTLSRLVAGYRQWRHGTGQLLRRGRTALVWGVQMVVYPVYAAMQAVRMAHRQLAASSAWQRWTARLRGTASPRSLTSDSPIRALLSAIQPQQPNHQPSGRSVKADRALLRQSRAAGLGLAQVKRTLAKLGQPIQGIASDLQTQQLVLVAQDNQILSVLTTAQQDRLQQAIALLLDTYGRLSAAQPLGPAATSLGLPLPEVKPSQWWPVQWVYQFIAWMQTSILAVVTDLFGESQAMKRMWLASGEQGFVRLPGVAPVTSHSLPLVGKAGAGEDRLIDPRRQTQLVNDGAEADSPNRALSTQGAWQLTAQMQNQPTLNLGQGQAAVIEAQVTGVNYVDHPLVWVLRWLDRGLCWLETRLRQVWQWLQDRC